ncbi:transglycosylase SLT domain-containing protein [Vreelandella massiliensis]|uniref:transglycosylase SLT domain-containing protein n=1 Tax=Vreelandella massiliensis TaxID=1816686 RepID=UPI00096A3FA5|nr:transglycosylase SLT domain-containing protein [Halomonas massiliensis]
MAALSRRASVMLFAALSFSSAHAEERIDCLTSELQGDDNARAEYIAALKETTELYDIAPEIMVAIKLTESGRSLNPAVKNVNRNRTVDRGYYQVNADVWLPVMRDLGLNVGDSDMHDVRKNSLIAGWVLRRQFNRFPDSPYEGVGHYHRGGGTDEHANGIRARYMSKFMPHLRRLISRCQ